MALGAARPAIRCREPDGRRRKHRYRGSRAFTGRRLYVAPGWFERCNQYQALREALLQLHSRHRADRGSHPFAKCHGGQSVRSSHDRSRVYRLCESQSWQDKHGICWHRNRAACRWRVVQYHGRRQLGSCAISRRTGSIHRSYRRTGAGKLPPIDGSIEHIRTGKLRALAVAAVKRSEVLPDVPTLGEFLPGFEASVFLGIGAPKGTPAAIVGRLNKEISAALTDSNIRARYADLGTIVLGGSPADFGKLIADDTEKWGKVIRAANIKAD